MKFTIKRNVGQYLRKNEMRIAADVYNELDGKIEKLLLGAVKRARMNRRNTILIWDL